MFELLFGTNFFVWNYLKNILKNRKIQLKKPVISNIW